MIPKEIIRVGPLELYIRLDGTDTNNQMVVFESVCPPGAKVAVPPHYHEHVDEMVYGLEGVLTCTVGGKEIEVGPGDCCFIPRGTIHHLGNDTQEPARSLAVSMPAAIGPAYFREMSNAIKPGTPPDPEIVKEIMLRYGLIPA